MIKDKLFAFFLSIILCCGIASIVIVFKMGLEERNKKNETIELLGNQMEYQINLIEILYDSDNINEKSKDHMLQSIETHGPYDIDIFNKEISLAKSIHLDANQDK